MRTKTNFNPRFTIIFAVILSIFIAQSCEKEDAPGIDNPITDRILEQTLIESKGTLKIPERFQDLGAERSKAASQSQERYYQIIAAQKKKYLQPQREIQTSKSTGNSYSVPGDFATLQQAVDAASPGDEIIVTQDLVDQGGVFIYKDGLTLKSNSETKYQVPAEWIVILGSNVHISGLNFDLLNTLVADGVSGFQLSNNVLNSQSWASLLLVFCTDANISGNHISGYEFGARIDDSNDNVFTSNNFYLIDATLSRAAPLFLVRSNDNLITNCQADGGGSLNSLGFWVEDQSQGNHFKNCISSNGDASFVVTYSHENEFYNCTSSDANFGFAVIGGTENEMNSCRADHGHQFGFFLWTVDIDESADGNSIINGKSNNNHVGLVMNAAMNSLIQGGRFNENYRGIQDQSGFDNTIDNNVTNDNDDSGIFCIFNGGTTIKNSKSNGNWDGIVLAITQGGVTLQNNLANDNENYGVLLQFTNGTTIGGCIGKNNGSFDLSVEGSVNFVDEGNNKFGTVYTE